MTPRILNILSRALSIVSMFSLYLDADVSVSVPEIVITLPDSVMIELPTVVVPVNLVMVPVVPEIVP